MKRSTGHKRGRRPIAATTSQLPATTLPSVVHDAIIAESLERDVSVAQVVRDALIFHLKNRQTQAPAPH